MPNSDGDTSTSSPVITATVSESNKSKWVNMQTLLKNKTFGQTEKMGNNQDIGFTTEEYTLYLDTTSSMASASVLVTKANTSTTTDTVGTTPKAGSPFTMDDDAQTITSAMIKEDSTTISQPKKMDNADTFLNTSHIFTLGDDTQTATSAPSKENSTDHSQVNRTGRLIDFLNTSPALTMNDGPQAVTSALFKDANTEDSQLNKTDSPHEFLNTSPKFTMNDDTQAVTSAIS